MSTDPSVYEGTEQLEALEAARAYNAHLTERILDCAQSSRREKGWKALDFGAGLGRFAQAVRAGGAEVECVEPDIPMREKLSSSGFVAHADLDGIPTGSLDFAYSLNVLEHIEEDTRTLCSIADRLKPQAGLYLYVPAFPILYSNNDRVVGHVRRYSRGELQSKVAAAGFVVESSHYVDPLGFGAALAYRFWPTSDGNLSHRSVGWYDRFVFPVSRQLQPWTSQWFGKNIEVRARKL